ncbi:uncharacterized protein LOC117608015 [Osmia lignaria lignaria]|uniref:uncharacterized protein LOC117608015 n=1 Tax=Osmia lignaria lignaria TaxID=1437193 RepID=UPI00402B4FFE
MPSFLARFLGLSFRTERLIMNIIGLINSTLDWSPLKWTNELEQIQNISLSYSTLILSTIGEDRIKSVLSWIVIIRIIIAHIYTFTYLTNIYPIITWSRPCLLLPWLILSFFKNVVLEVIVLAVCLLYWYDKRFSLAIFLEFIIVKLVPLILASYNWYSNSCLFLELRYAEKLRKLKRTLKSDTNFVTNRLCMKIADSKYRTRSLTTLLSYESYDTFNSQDTISRILDDNDLTPAEKTIMILGITEQDIIDARAGKKEREDYRRLTEVDDKLFKARKFALKKFYMLTKDYEDQESFFRPNNEELVEDSLVIEEVPLPSEAPTETIVETLPEVTENPIERSELNNSGKVDEPKLNNPGKVDEPKLNNSKKVDEPKLNNSGEINTLKLDNPIKVDEPKLNNSGKIDTPKLDNPIKVDATEPSSNEEKEEINSLQKNETKQNEKCSFSSKDVEANSSSTQKRNCPRLSNMKPETKNVENDCNLIKFQSLFNCDCSVDDNVFKDGRAHCCLPDNFMLKTSTPNESRDTGRIKENLESDDLMNQNDGALMLKNLLKNDLQSSMNLGNEVNSKESILEEKLKEEVQVPNESLLINYAKILEHENLKQEVREITDAVKRLFISFNEDPCLKGSYIDEKSIERTKDKNRCGPDQNISIGVQNLSEVVKDMKIANPVENYEMLTTIDLEKSKVKLKSANEVLKSMIPIKSPVLTDINSTEKNNSYKPEVRENRLRVNIPEYSFGDTNIPRFYKDSMKVFDGCYEQDFANNSELQCVLQQLEKKKWNPFDGQSNLETLLQQDDEINQSTVRALRNVSSPVKDCEKTNRFKSTVHVSSVNTFHSENLTSQKTQVTERSLEKIPKKLCKFSPTNPIKNSYTQTDSVNSSSKINIITDSKNRKKITLKRKYLKDQSSISSMNDHQNNKIKTRYFANSQSDKVIKQSNQSKSSLSSSDKSVCECKMQQLETKCSPSLESRREDRRKSSSKPKVDTFDTVNLAQVARPSNFNGSANKRKPPICPKKVKKELSSSMLPKITPMIRKLQESKKPKTKSRVESSNDKEMRALKAYNEVTLVMDKKQLDAKRKIPPSKTTLNVLHEESKHRLRPRKSNSKKKLGVDKKLISEEYLNKENLSADASVDLKPSSVATSSKVVNESGKVLQLSNEVYTCSKLQQGHTKMNRVTDKILDRLFSIEKHSLRKSSAETDTRKQLSKYSKPKQMGDEEVVSASSSKKLEGMQNGRELERTQAKEDIRDEFKYLTNSSGVQPLIESGKGTKDSKPQQDSLLLTIKSSVNQDVVSTWSSSTISQLEETQEAEKDDLPVMNQPQAILDPEDSTKDPTEVPKVHEESLPLKQNEIRSVPEEINSNTTNLQNNDGTRRTTNYTDFTRNIDVSYLVHGVVLSNQNTPKSKNPRQRDIVDDATSRLLHTAFSYQSMDSVLDFAADTLNVNNIMNETHLDPLDDGFVQLSNDVVDELPLISHDHGNLEEAIPAIFRESQDFDEQAENCDLLITTVDEEHSNDVFSIVGQFLRNLNIGNITLDNVDDPGLSVLQDLLRGDDGEENDTIEEENDTTEEESEEDLEDDQTLRFIKEDVFTDIKFPIVINWSDSLIASDVDHEELNPMIRDAGIRPTGLLCLSGPEEEKLKDVKLECEETKNVEQSVFFAKLEYSSGSGKLKHEEKNVYLEEESEKEIEEDFGKSKSISSDEAAYGMYRTIKYFESEETASETESEENVKFEEEETIVNEEGAMLGNVEEIIKGFQLFNINDTILMEESMELEETELPDRNAQPIDFKDEEEKIILIEKIEELEDTEESNEIENITYIQNNQDDEEEEITVLERVSPLTIFLFWMIGCLFYVQFWCRKIFSAEISSSTSTLNPFEIHAAPVSTMKLLEKIEEKEEEEDDSLKEIVNFDMEADFRMREQYSSNIIEFTNDSEEIEKEVEEAMLSLSEHISKNVKIPSFLNSDEEKTQSNLSSIASAIRDTETSRQNIFQTTNERLREFRAAEEEIKTFRFEEADDCSSTKSLLEHNEETKLSVDNQLNYPEIKIDEDGPDKEEILENDEKKEEEKKRLKSETTVEEIVEEAESSTEKKQSAARVPEPNFQNTDSFDSTYSKISDTSKRTISDLHASSMEEFEDSLNS